MNEWVGEDFPCLLIKSDIETTKIIWLNTFAYDYLGLKKPVEAKIAKIVSKASLIFYESYIKPIILANGKYLEVQITLISEGGRRVPAVANLTLSDNIVYWAIYVAEERDKLYQELLEARDLLEKKTEELTAVSRKDSLTPLLNRRAAKDDINVLIKQSSQAFLPLSFLLLDIDFFKNINDTFGHDEGDKVLVALSKLLLEQVRETDVVARWGGEEFLIVLLNANIESIKSFSDKLHNAIETIVLPNGNPLTVSIGGAVLEQDELKESDVIAAQLLKADKALYSAKDNQRAHTRIFDKEKGFIRL